MFLGVVACKDDEKGNLTIHFKALYDGQPLSMFNTKPFTNPEQLQFTHLSFLVSDLALVDQSNTVDLDDIELVDLSFDDVNDADLGYIIQFKDIDARNYSGIKFGIGVPADLNAKTPSEFPSNHPLSKTGYYWEAWSSYIFTKIEGHIDTLGIGDFTTGFAYHTGTDDLYLPLEAPVPITIEDGKNKVIEIVIDYKEVLDGINIKANPQNHNPADSIQIAQIVENLSHAITLIQ